MSDEEIQGFIDYFGDEIPDPEHYHQKVIWLIKWYKHIVLKNRKDDEREYN